MKLPSALALLATGAVAAQLSRLGVPGRYRYLYERAGKTHGVDPNLLHALALQESRENPRAVSAPNANQTRDYGMMQINTANLARYALTETTALDPARSVDAAARLLRDNFTAAPHLGLLDQIAVYNAGFSAHREGGKLRPKLTTDGTYTNQAYVMQAASWYVLIVLGSLAPVRKLGWNTTGEGA